MIINLRRKNRNYTICLFIEIVVAMVSLIFITSMFMDIYMKIKDNNKVMDLDKFINVSNQELKIEDSIPYYKSMIIKDIDTGKSYDAILISSKFLEVKKFIVQDGETFKDTIDETEVLIGSNLKNKVGESININCFSNDIELKVKGILEKEQWIWKDSNIIPKSLDNSIVILDRETDNMVLPKVFSEKEGENLITIRKYIISQILEKGSSIYISLMFILILFVMVINSINLTVTIILNRKRKEFGIRYALGSTEGMIFNSIINEFAKLSSISTFVAVLISIIIQRVIPRELGYTFNFNSFILAIGIYIVVIMFVLYKNNKKISRKNIGLLIKGSLE